MTLRKSSEPHRHTWIPASWIATFSISHDHNSSSCLFSGKKFARRLRLGCRPYPRPSIEHDYVESVYSTLMFDWGLLLSMSLRLFWEVFALSSTSICFKTNEHILTFMGLARQLSSSHSTIFSPLMGRAAFDVFLARGSVLGRMQRQRQLARLVISPHSRVFLTSVRFSGLATASRVYLRQSPMFWCTAMAGPRVALRMGCQEHNGKEADGALSHTEASAHARRVGLQACGPLFPFSIFFVAGCR